MATNLGKTGFGGWIGALAWLTLAGCSDTSGSLSQPEMAAQGGAELGLRLKLDAEPITSVDEALEGVFVPPFSSCREPDSDPAGLSDGGQVCTNVSISGATEPGRYYPDYGDCDVVRSQRPFWEAPRAGEPDPEDPRLQDPEFAAELAWITEQAAASACTCCHDSSAAPSAQWDISAGGVWLDTLSDSGLALFAGLADSSVFGAYPPQDNNGFAREETGLPTTDVERMREFMLAELKYRGITLEEAQAVPPFGGPIYTNSVAVPKSCAPGEGVTPDGDVIWKRGEARYVYLLREGSDNPGVPPNFDMPEGTLWRLDVPPNQPPLTSGIAYGTTPEGTLQALPQREGAPELLEGERYQLNVQLDVGIPLANCVFTFGQEPEAQEQPQEPVEASDEFGASCTDSSQCAAPADYCALLPGQSDGYCTATGCADDNAEACPQDWGCLDLSTFAPGQPSICTSPAG